jgi:hypothetical protein
MTLSMGESPLPFPKNTEVRFSAAYLAKCTDSEARRLRGRVGVVTGYRAGASLPIVEFARAGRFPALKLFEVPVARLEVAATTGEGA